MTPATRILFAAFGLWLALVLGVFASDARAEGTVPVTSQAVYKCTWPNDVSKTATGSSGFAACSEVAARFGTRTEVNGNFRYDYSASVLNCPNSAVCDVELRQTCTRVSNGTQCDPPLVSQATYGYTGPINQDMCPANSTLTGPTTCTCDAGYNASGGVCVPSAENCTTRVGHPSIRNFTIGWSRTDGSGENSAWDASVISAGAALHGSTICDGKCSGSLDLKAPGAKAWQAQSPNAQGLYRLSVDGEVSWSGASCTSSQTTEAIRPDAQSPPCNGYVGQVKMKGQEKTVCVAKVGTTDAKYTAEQPIQKGNPGAGSLSSAGQGEREGSGTNSGNADGGPATVGYGQIRGGAGDATTGSGGTGNDPTGDIEFKTCGRPGDPPCKVDETGTPGGGEVATAKGAAIGALGTAIDGIGDGIKNINGSDKRESLPWSPSALLLPIGVCQAQTTETRLGPIVFDPCSSPIANLWRALLGWLVYMLTILYAWRSVVGATGGK